MNSFFYVEQVNPNDENYKIVSRYIEDYQKVSIGDLVFTLEGQKAAIEVSAEKEGFFFSPFVVGSFIQSADVAYYIFDTDSECAEFVNSLKNINCASDESIPLKAVSGDNNVSDLIVELNDPVIRVAILPGGRAYRQIQDAVQGNTYIKVIGYFDDAYRVGPDYLGEIDFDSILNGYKRSDFDRIFVASGSSKFRTDLINKLAKLGIKFINIIHPSSFVSNDATIGCNVYIGPFVQIASRAIVSDGVFISGGSNVEHHCSLSENCLLGPGVYLSGGVSVGKRSVLGAGVSVESNIDIGDDVYITSGKGINKNIKSKERLID